MRRVAPIARALASLSLISGAVALVLVGAHLNRARVLRGIDELPDSEGAPSSLLTADSLVQAAGVALVLLAVTEFVLLVVWTWRMAVNVRSAGRPARMSNGFAIGGFFIPIANFVIPFLFFRDFVRAVTGPGAADPGRYTVMIWWWWLQIGSLFFTSEPQRALSTATIGDYIAADQSLATGRVVLAVSAALGAVTFRRFSKDAFPGV